MIIAGLDIATQTGVCLGEPGQTPEFFTRDLGQKRTHDLRFSNAMGLAFELIDQHNVKFIGIEAPILTKRDSRAKLQLLYGLIACVQAWAHRKGVDCQIFEIPTLDKSFIGTSGMKSDDRKRAIMARCHQMGWKPQTQDEADAGSVFFHACATQSRSYGILNSPLFQGRGAA